MKNSHLGHINRFMRDEYHITNLNTWHFKDDKDILIYSHYKKMTY